MFPDFAVSSLPDKVNRGHPSSVKSKHQNSGCALLFFCSFSLSLSVHSLCVTGCYRRTVKPHSVQIMRLLAGLPVDPNQHGRVRAVKTYKGESSEEVADPPVTLSPRGVAAALAVCVFQCNLWSRWLESWAESSRSQPTCHQDDVSWLLPSFS